MPQAPNTVTSAFEPLRRFDETPEVAPTHTDIWRAGFEQENDVYNFFKLTAEKSFKPQDGFDILKSTQERGVNARDYSEVLSDDELDYQITKRTQEQRNRDILSAGGWEGYAAMMVAGLLSPTTFIPFARGATGLKSIALGGISVLSGAAAQEAVLYANQETRTKGEVGFSLAASTIVGGLLGAAMHTMSKSVVDKIAHDMVHSPKEPTIHEPMSFGGDVGAKENDSILKDAGKLKKGWGADKLAFMSPITRGFEQWNAPSYIKEMGGSLQLRKMTAGFSQAGLSLQDNAKFIAAAAGGNVEDLKRTYGVISYLSRKLIDDNYIDYILGTEAKGPFKKSRAMIAGVRADGKLNYDEFKRQVTLDIWSNFTNEHTDPHVRRVAQAIDEKVYKKLYDEGVEVGLFTGEEKTVGDENYANRVYNNEIIQRRTSEFVSILQRNLAGKLQADFSKEFEKLREKMLKDKKMFETLELPIEEVRRLREEIKARAQQLEVETSLDVIEGIDAIKGIKNAVKELKKELDGLQKMKLDGADLEGFRRRKDRMDEIEAALKSKAAQAEGTQKALGEGMEKYTKELGEIRRRLVNLSQANALKDERLGRKLDKIEANEDMQVQTILRAQKQLMKFVKMLDSATAEKIDEAASKLKDKFNEQSERLGKLEQKLNELETGEEPKFKRAAKDAGLPPEMVLSDKMDSVAAKMDELAEKIEKLDAYDADAFKREIDDMMRELADTHAKINAKRAVRNEKLWKDVEKLSPEARKAKIDALKLKSSERPKDFVARWNTKGELNISKDEAGDLLKGEANFDEYAKELAEATTTKILGSERRLAYSDIIQAERGPELARVLNISSEEISDFLETDIEKLVSIYTRTVGSDLAIARVFGTADGAEAFKKLSDERKLMLDKIETLTDKKGNPLTPEQKEELSYKTHQFYDAGQKDLMVLMERAKSSRGLPKDADSFSARAAKTAMDLNYLRLMGGVVINSVADVARPVMKYGLTRTFRDGIIPMIRNFKTIRMSQREARLAGTALDVVMHTRANSLMDIFDDAYRGTIAEKGIHFLSTRMGAIALFDQWTVAMKEFTAGLANAKLMDAIAIVNGEKATAKEIKKAQEFLARNNIDGEIAGTIWAEVTNGKGGGKVNGIWLPNTEDWNVKDPQVARARRAYRGALGGEVDSTIITPGFERPNWVDSSVPARMLAQFKSFGLSSVQKTMMAGLQEHDAAALNGAIGSLALGMISYYLWATAAGGDAEKKMQKAISDGNWAVWADEAIARSGLTGVFGDAQKYAHRIPVLRDYTSFSGNDSTRRAGGDLTESVLGPSFDLLEKAHGLITGIDEPTKQTLHLARQMLPLQNVFYLRQLLDKVEQSIDLPEQRTK